LSSGSLDDDLVTLHPLGTTVCDEGKRNIHAPDAILADKFVTMQTALDATLDRPKPILPAIQVNMRGDRGSPAEDDHQHESKTSPNAP
jgi:hypothetical protein